MPDKNGHEGKTNEDLEKRGKTFEPPQNWPRPDKKKPDDKNEDKD